MSSHQSATRHQAQPTSTQHTKPRPPHHLGAILLIFVGFALRLYHLGAESLWYDETVSAYLASQPIPELIAHTARDIHPPAYYLLLALWKQLSHPSVAFGLEFLYAWPSFFFSILVTTLTYAIARRAFGTTAAYWALALCVLHPVQIWFAQEVRMYALGAFALMLTLWAILPLLQQPKSLAKPNHFTRQTLILYPLAALLGLYTLYYFAFWLIVLNAGILFHIRKSTKQLLTWLLLQGVILIGWLPWLPTFIHQATNPPVPPWRAPWTNALEFLNSASEGIAATWIAHIQPLEISWPWAIGVLITTTAFYLYAKSITKTIRLTWLLFCFGPLALLLIISIIGPAIYHVRYVATYAPIFPLLIGALLANVSRTKAVSIFTAFVIVSTATLHQFWTNPRYAADDHRGAVQLLAKEWRPGDLILVNAGWAYPILATYWPTELPIATASRPPQIAHITRLDQLAETAVTPPNAPLIISTGSVDGSSNLGWGLPESDFFAISQQETIAALDQLATQYARIWHFRLYDTVSDPTGVIRQWFNENTTHEFSQAIPGRDYLLVEAYRTTRPTPVPLEPTNIHFPQANLTLQGQYWPSTIAAGETLYVALSWQTQATDNRPPAAQSLRLYDSAGQQILQSDTPITILPSGQSQMLALPIPANLPTGNYQLALIVYSPNTLAPYETFDATNTLMPTPLPLGTIIIDPVARN